MSDNAIATAAKRLELVINTLLALAIIGFGLFWFHSDGFSGNVFTCGALELKAGAVDDCDGLLTPSAAANDGNYDSLDLPLGTSYSVATGRTFLLAGVSLTVGSTTTTVQFGYGDTHVEDSGPAPTNAVTLGVIQYPASAGLVVTSITGEVPAGKFPWVLVTGPATWPSRVTLYGVQR